MFSKRSNDPEIMDDLNCNGKVVEQTLKELDFINTWLGGNKITLDAVNKALSELSKEKTIRIADLGCGGGDILKRIAKKARKNNVTIELVGFDANPFIIDYAQKNCRDYPEIQFKTIDVLSDEFRKERFDIVNCTLFCHHFDDITLKDFIKNLYGQTNYCIIINDIHRHWFAYHSIKWLTKIFSSSEMVKYDARLSVLRAFLKEELDRIFLEAGLTNYSVKWRWAFRYEVVLDCRKN